ncbi:hypothetical protein Tco_0802507 [Tanacetum coccineum]|uniref:Reverse transcriptase domain-containing protein n=1 Tax=Tanacetum coccineum TaxID=301880 RepID=A0ABQ4ZYZ9_9ASTR
MTPPSGFSTPPQIPNNTTSERPPVTTTVFAATTPKNTPFAYHASTSANPNPMISPAFVEANYEILESLLRERRRQIRNEDLQTELEYFSEDYDEEREMEPRPEPHREATPTLWPRSPVVHRQRERVMGFEEAPNREGSRRGRNAEGTRPSEIEAREGSFADSTGSVTPFVRWIEDYPLPDGLKMPSHIGSYDGKEDPDNFLHLFKGAIRMQKWLMPVACHMFTYTLKDYAAYGGIIRKQVLGLHEEQCISGFVHGLRTRSLVEHLSTDLPSTYKGRRDPLEIITEDKKAWIGSPYTEDQTMDCSLTCPKAQERSSPQKKAVKSFEQPPRMFGSRRSRDMSKYCHFHEDHGHDTNDCRQLRNQIEEAVKSGQLSHLVKGIKKERVKTSENQRTEGKKDKSTAPAEAPILMIRQDESYTKNKFESLTFEGKEITFPSGDSNSSTPVEKNPGQLGNPSGNHDRTAMQRMGIVVSTIHGAIKFHTAEGIGTVFSTYESDKVKEEVKKVRKTPPASEKGVFSCTTAEEKVIINNKYPEQTVTIGKQLPEHFKRRLRDLLKANADVFAWTHADMTGIPRTIMVKGKPFNTKHKLNEYSHVKPIKQKRRGLGPDRSTTACKEVEELMKAGIL